MIYQIQGVPERLIHSTFKDIPFSDADHRLKVFKVLFGLNAPSIDMLEEKSSTKPPKFGTP